MGEETKEVTELLVAWSQGDQNALAKLTPLVYEELHRVAQRHMAGECPGHTLQPTALVHEAYLRLVDFNDVQWKNRAHFFAVAAGLMRRILVDFARSRRSQKRGGVWHRVTLDDALLPSVAPASDLVAIDEALDDLAKVDVRKAQVVELRFFGGLSTEETAEVLDISTDTVGRDWNLAKVWLSRQLKRGRAAEDAGAAGAG